MLKKVALGVSGGVDSAVAALILKRRGFEVQGVFMQNWDIRDETGRCSADADFNDAQIVCNKLNIPLHHVNFVKQYWNEVFCNLIKDYENGYTPNPDILCNKNIKFNHFYKYAMEELKVDAIATGHYANTSFGPFLENFQPDKAVRLLRSNDTKKDQTFFLSQISQEALRKTMFPLGELMKWEVKQIALENDLEIFARKPESMGICFIGSRNFQHFIQDYIIDKPGNFVDIDTGKIVGQHNGIHQWTIGQRTRLQGLPEAYFTVRKNMEENVIYVVCETEKGLSVMLEKNKRALAAGQYAVFYKNAECLGSAQIYSGGLSNFTYYYLKNKTLEKSVTPNIDKKPKTKLGSIKEDILKMSRSL